MSYRGSKKFQTAESLRGSDVKRRLPQRQQRQLFDDDGLDVTCGRILPVAAFVEKLWRHLHLIEDLSELIDMRLCALGLETLACEYFQALKTIEEVSLIDFPRLEYFWNGGRVQRNIKIPEARWPLSEWPQINPTRFVIEWSALCIPAVQMMLEALPIEGGRECGEIFRGFDLGTGTGHVAVPGSNSEFVHEVARAFHTAVKRMYKEFGIEYHPLQLYRDDLDSISAIPILYHTHLAFASKQSKKLAEASLISHHGVVVRMGRPSLQITGQSKEDDKWDGSFEFATLDCADNAKCSLRAPFNR